MGEVRLFGYRCERCGHEWMPRNKKNEPKVCPRCKSPYWNIPRKKGGRKKIENLVPKRCAKCGKPLGRGRTNKSGVCSNCQRDWEFIKMKREKNEQKIKT